MPYAVREGINIFLGGYVPTENLKFRDYALEFHTTGESALEEELAKMDNMSPKSRAKEKARLKSLNYSYPSMEISLGPFHLAVEGGSFNASETIVMLG